MSMQNGNDIGPGILASSVMRQIVVWCVAAFAAGTAYTALHADVEAIAKENKRTFEIIQKELNVVQQNHGASAQDLRERLRAVEGENARDRERYSLLETRLSVIETNILHIRSAIDNMSPRRGQGDGLPR